LCERGVVILSDIVSEVDRIHSKHPVFVVVITSVEVCAFKLVDHVIVAPVRSQGGGCDVDNFVRSGVGRDKDFGGTTVTINNAERGKGGDDVHGVDGLVIFNLGEIVEVCTMVLDTDKFRGVKVSSDPDEASDEFTERGTFAEVNVCKTFKHT
jgi:hypothetical protein